MTMSVPGETSVSPVPTPSMRAMPTMLPGPASVTGFCFFPCRRYRPLILTCALPRDETTSGESAFNVPVKTRATESLPC